MEHHKPERRSVQLEDSKWTGYFIDAPPLPCYHQNPALIAERRDELLKKVRDMVHGYTSSKKKLLDGMRTVDAIERLGVGYHLEHEISKFMHVLSSTTIRDGDLAGIALRFRLLRQHRYDIPCDVIQIFKDDRNGDFKDTLRSDVEALLSLYEAAHLGKCGEGLLSDAVVFTTSCLSSLLKHGQLPEAMFKKIQHALTSPTQRRMKRLEAKLYISIYEKDNERNQDVLELAKLDFHLLQLMHRDELKSMSLWYKKLDRRSTLGEYIRERPVECYFWALGVFYEPHYAKARMMFAKLIKIFSFFDDTFDSYGTLEELRLFNQAVQSWDEEAASRIGKCFGYVMSLLSNTLEECLADGASSPLAIDCIKETMKVLSECMLQEVVWREEGQVPRVRDHLEVTAISTFYWALASISFAGMDAGDDVFTWAITYPKIIQNAATISRLMDDISGHECEKERSNIPTAVDCYVKEHGLTVEEAKEALRCVLEEQWRSINQEFLSNGGSSAGNGIPASLLTRVIDLARVMESLYKKIDGYTHCSGIVDAIDSVLDKCVCH